MLKIGVNIGGVLKYVQRILQEGNVMIIWGDSWVQYC